jgi:hypothetical protein
VETGIGVEALRVEQTPRAMNCHIAQDPKNEVILVSACEKIKYPVKARNKPPSKPFSEQLLCFIFLKMQKIENMYIVINKINPINPADAAISSRSL